MSSTIHNLKTTGLAWGRKIDIPKSEILDSMRRGKLAELKLYDLKVYFQRIMPNEIVKMGQI